MAWPNFDDMRVIVLLADSKKGRPVYVWKIVVINVSMSMQDLKQ